jgi:hypothetical protein
VKLTHRPKIVGRAAGEISPERGVVLDARDGVASTQLDSYREHVCHVHPAVTGQHIPEPDVDRHARHGMETGIDIHVHA